MQAPSPLLARLDLTGDRPTVGALMALCEENYRALMQLAPRLASLSGVHASQRPGHASLELQIIDQAPYTTTLRLTHVFPATGGCSEWLPEPDATLKAYHDAGQVEVLDLRQTALPIFSHYQSPALYAKWKANLFLSKWLGWCLRDGHRVGPPLAAESGHCGNRLALPSTSIA
ncbi:MAG: DUF1249 domain-containing protein [Thiohalocapsa sp.]|jgi:hypothetical protein|uniref:DUF1249 domain-containing protein n=1 Tax=Thiohalocapsa sp. TaxID=2497641 RepID=UPI0025FBA001|nr:DUF1249 domain-containing protein [Thiohalocapsa sp.]MCG6940728.1 DUF1249 domain-containing protein [Thiohalocapsa sp.]